MQPGSTVEPMHGSNGSVLPSSTKLSLLYRNDSFTRLGESDPLDPLDQLSQPRLDIGYSSRSDDVERQSGRCVRLAYRAFALTGQEP